MGEVVNFEKYKKDKKGYLFNENIRRFSDVDSPKKIKGYDFWRPLSKIYPDFIDIAVIEDEMCNPSLHLMVKQKVIER